MKNLCFILCLLPFMTNAQADASSGTIAGLGNASSTTAMSQVMTTKVMSMGKKNPRFNNVTGSAYMSDIFLPTKLYYNTKFVENTYYRYNAYNMEVEIKKNPSINDENISALNKDKKIEILVDGHKLGFKTFVTSKNKTLNGYLSTLIDDKSYDLYKREHIIFSPGRESTNSFVKDVPSRFIKFTEYYFQKEGVNRMDEILPSNRAFLKMLEGEDKNEIKAFLKEHKLNVKNEADLIKVFEKLNKK